MHTRELLRSKRALVALLVSFAAFPVPFWGIDILIAAATGSPAGLLRKSLPLIAVTGFMAVALILTTVQLVTYRSNGVLLQLATTPACRTAFLLGHVPVRAGILALEGIVIIVIASADGILMRDVGLLAVTLLLGGAMMLAFGYLLAARMTNPDLALQLSYIFPMIALFTSGAVFPLESLPEWITIVFRAFPSTWFVDALSALIANSTPSLPIGANWALMTLVAAGTAYVAVRSHQWISNE
ncbi:ABC transporter permease [Cryobacterium sp. Y57]|uniref:ABC transporter permease n=1 Tax=Cryobacterium sp. Y57 TaxID=2048287 RepID=UPI001304B818|nr:ABC transporter permease [Cryobacterium sp. Y57]